MADHRASLENSVASLKELLGADMIVTQPEALWEAAHDALRRSRSSPHAIPSPVLPLAVVRPRRTEDVATVVRFAAAHRLPLVELGGGSGLMGGARSVFPGLVLDLRGMNRILEISEQDRTACVQAGVVLGDLDAELNRAGLMLGHDPWTVPVATVGGTISTNSLGYRGARYGSMGDQVLGIEVVLGDGSILRTRPAARSSTGPRLRHLFIGAEGTMGVITEAVIRVFPAPERRVLRAITFPDFDTGFHAIEACFAIGLAPAMVDYGQTYAGSRSDSTRFSPAGARAKLYLAFEGFAEEAEAADRRAMTICLRHGGTLLPAGEAERFWSQRHVVAEHLRERRKSEQEEDWIPAGVRIDFVHVSLPASQVLPFRDRAATIMAERDVSVVEWGLWNQPELFSVVVQRPIQSDIDGKVLAEAADNLVRLAQDMGGSMEYCHGAGLRLAPLMAREHGHGLDVLRQIKTIVDPYGVLNPGKLDLDVRS